jgi:hypothetical protein
MILIRTERAASIPSEFGIVSGLPDHIHQASVSIALLNRSASPPCLGQPEITFAAITSICSTLAVPERKPYGESGTPADFAVHQNGSAMCFHYLFCNPKAQSQTFVRRGRIDALEPIENSS